MNATRKICAIIPARGGSKGIPRKNIQRVGGIPLIGRTILAAKDAPSIDSVAVSTDSDEIAMVATQYGATVIRRPAEIAGDVAASEAAVLHALGVLSDKNHYQPDIVVFLQCTSPFTQAADIEIAIEKMDRENADVAFSVSSSHGFLWKKGTNGDAQGVNHNGKSRPMRQQREPEFMETGAFYAMRTQGFLEHKFRFFGKKIMIECDPMRAMEIDLVDELLMARALAAEIDGQSLPNRTSGKNLSDIKALVMDFDGVFTDDRVLVQETGQEAVFCSRSDGFGLEQLRKSRLRLVVVSREKNQVVSRRCEKLGLEVAQGVDDKLATLNHWCAANALSLEDIAYVGNDVPDLPCMLNVAFAFAPNDAHPTVRRIAHVVLESRGGHGALRELSQLLGAQ